MRLFILVSLLFLNLFTYAQFCPFLGPDQFLPCGVSSTTLTADLSQCTPGNNPNQTTNYGVSSIPYVAQTNTGNQLFMGDDTQQGPFQIGFNFCYFGQTYTQFWVGSNGWISFSGGQPTTFTSASIPNAAFNIPKNCIMGPWQDWHPGIGGQIRYQVQGTAPCRKLVVSWINMPMFGCTQTLGTFHIVIYESSNYIENHIQSKQFCNWANGTAVQGIHNQAGTIGITVPGRNSTQWIANNDAWRWTPSGPVVTPTLTWYQIGNPNPIGTGQTITVNPPAAGANYTCRFVYPTCNAGWSSCNTGQGLGPDTVFVQPGPPNLSPPAVNITDPTCHNSCDGSINIVPSSGVAPFTISWTNPVLPSNFTQIGLCSGQYLFTLQDALGCNISSFANLINPDMVVINSINGLDTICANSTTNTYNVLSNTNFNYTWSTTLGQITNGQGTNQINLSASGINGSIYNTNISVYADSAGCLSQTENLNVTILDVIPSIDNLGPFCEYDSCVNLTAQPIGGFFTGNNLVGTQYCPNNGFIGSDTVLYTYNQSGCQFTDNIIVNVFGRPLISEIYNELGDQGSQFIELCIGDSITNTYMVNQIGNGINIWDFNNTQITSQNLQSTWNQTGGFYISVVNYENGCYSNPQDFYINIEQCPEDIIYIPNSFTPNGDELNHYWLPVLSQGIDEYDYNLVIFNRWGNILFESNNPLVGWDGYYQNLPCPVGVYVYRVNYKLKGTTIEKIVIGHINLLK